MTISTKSVPLLLKTAGIAVWALYPFGSMLTQHVGADTSFGGSFLFGLALWGAGTIFSEWFPEKPAT